LLQLLSEGYVEPNTPPPLPPHVFAQQIMALSLQERGTTNADWPAWLGRRPGLADVDADQLAGIPRFMIETGVLHSDQGLLGIGQDGERQFGDKHFMALFSVFVSPPSVKVFHGRQEIGEVHQSTFILKEDGPSVLTLAGRSWQTKYVDWPRRKAYVEPTDLRGRSRWLSAGQPLPFALCQAMTRVLAREGFPAKFSRRAVEFMQTLREDYDWVEPGRTVLVSAEDNSVVWWTFAGKLVNASIAQALREQAANIKSDNLCVSFVGGVDAAALRAAIRNLVLAETAERMIPLHESFIAELKFGECLPPRCREQELAARYDTAEALALLAGYPLVLMRGLRA
jgi:ATP-dependent Lhr-like helicase